MEGTTKILLVSEPAKEGRKRIANNIIKKKAEEGDTYENRHLKNYLNGEELGVVITLDEYRDLVRDLASEKTERSHLINEVNRLKDINKEQDGKIYELRTLCESHKAEVEHLREKLRKYENVVAPF